MAHANDYGFPGLKAHNTSTMEHELGSVWVVGDHAWMYVQATAAVAAGKIVTPNVAHVSVTNITGFKNTEDAGVKGVYVEDTGESWTENAYVGSYLYIASGTGAGQMKRIRSNTTGGRAYFEALYPEIGETDPFTTDPDTTSDIVIISPWRVKPTTSASEVEIVWGYAPSAFTANYYGFIICRGVGLPLSGTDNNALVAGKYVCPGDNTASGYCTGVKDGNDQFDATIFGYALHAGADGQAAPVYILGR